MDIFVSLLLFGVLWATKPEGRPTRSTLLTPLRRTRDLPRFRD